MNIVLDKLGSTKHHFFIFTKERKKYVRSWRIVLQGEKLSYQFEDSTPLAGCIAGLCQPCLRFTRQKVSRLANGVCPCVGWRAQDEPSIERLRLGSSCCHGNVRGGTRDCVLLPPAVITAWHRFSSMRNGFWAVQVIYASTAIARCVPCRAGSITLHPQCGALKAKRDPNLVSAWGITLESQSQPSASAHDPGRSVQN